MRTARHIQEASFAGLITDQVWERMILKRNPHFIAKSPVRDDTLIQAAVFPFRYRVGLSGIDNDQIARGGLVYPALDVDPDCTPDDMQDLRMLVPVGRSDISDQCFLWPERNGQPGIAGMSLVHAGSYLCMKMFHGIPSFLPGYLHKITNIISNII